MSAQPAHDLRLEFDLADRMRKALRVSDVSVQEMADHLEMSRNTISSWINGRNTPRRRDLRDFALRAGVPLDWLQTGETPPHDGDGVSGWYTPRDSNPEPTDSGTLAPVTVLFGAALDDDRKPAA